MKQSAEFISVHWDGTCFKGGHRVNARAFRKASHHITFCLIAGDIERGKGRSKIIATLPVGYSIRPGLRYISQHCSLLKSIAYIYPALYSPFG
jgi:hypothetical protein